MSPASLTAAAVLCVLVLVMQGGQAAAAPTTCPAGWVVTQGACLYPCGNSLIVNQNSATSGFDMWFAIGSPAPLQNTSRILQHTNLIPHLCMIGIFTT